MKKPERVKSYKQLSARVAGADVRRAFKCECPRHNTLDRIEVVVKIVAVLVALYMTSSMIYWVWAEAVAPGKTFVRVQTLVAMSALVFLLVLGERLERRRWIRLHERYVIEEGIPSYIRGKINETRDRLVGHGSRFHKLVVYASQVVIDVTYKKKFVEHMRSDTNKTGLFCSDLDRQANKLDECLQLQVVADKLGKCEKLIVDYHVWQRWRIALIAAKHRTTSLDVYSFSVMRELWVAEANEVLAKLYALKVEFELIISDEKLNDIENCVSRGRLDTSLEARIHCMPERLKKELEKISPGFLPAETNSNEISLCQRAEGTDDGTR